MVTSLPAKPKKHPGGKNCPPNKKAGTWVYAWTCFRINLFIDYPQSMYFSNKNKGGKYWFKSLTLCAKGNSRFVWKKIRNLGQISHIQPNFGDFGVTEMDLRWQISCNPPINYKWVYLHNDFVLFRILPLLQILHMHQGIIIFMYTICTRVCVFYVDHWTIGLGFTFKSSFKADLLFEETLQRARLPSDFTTATEDDAFKLASQNRLGSSQLKGLRNMQSNRRWVKLGLWQILICMNKVALKLDKFHDFHTQFKKKKHCTKPT